MSWKSIVSAGLLCVLASPALAAPTLSVTNGPTLNAQGNWVWNVSIAPTSTSVVAAELGFTANRPVVGSPTRGTEFTGADTENPGNPIFGWETLSDTDEDGTVETNGDDEPVGVQVDGNDVFAALGSFSTTGFTGQQNYLTIVTAGPSDTALTGSLQVLGAYGAGGDEGRIAEETSPTTSANFRNYVGTASRTVVAGDANLSGVGTPGQAAVTLSDLTILATNLNKATGGPFFWQHGDFNGTVGGTEVTLADLTILATNLNKTNLTGASSPLTVTGILDPALGGGASLGGSAVPEPASLALVGLAVLGGLGLSRRRR